MARGRGWIVESQAVGLEAPRGCCRVGGRPAGGLGLTLGGSLRRKPVERQIKTPPAPSSFLGPGLARLGGRQFLEKLLLQPVLVPLVLCRDCFQNSKAPVFIQLLLYYCLSPISL